jgi:hypothetical protein
MGMKHTRIAVTAVALVIAFVAAAAFALNGSNRPAPVRVLQAAGRGFSPLASPSAAPAAQPIAAAAQLAGFVCGSSSLAGGQAGANALVSAIRTGSHPGYDRLVIEFVSASPSLITLTPQANSGFVNSPRGDTVTVAGAAGLHVVIRGADAHTAYGGPIVLTPNGSGLVEVRRIEDFEGYVGLGLGLAKLSCYRAFMLTNPSRLVIDVQVG